MNFDLSSVSFERCLDICLIREDHIPEVRTDQDIIVGSNRKATWTIPNGINVKVRDIIVLGQLTIVSEDMSNQAEKGAFVARDMLIAGQCKIERVDYEADRCYIPVNREKFYEELQDVIIGWFKLQRDVVNKIGLKSVLLRPI